MHYVQLFHKEVLRYFTPKNGGAYASSAQNHRVLDLREKKLADGEALCVNIRVCIRTACLDR
jgi:hypothetical protein